MGLIRDCGAARLAQDPPIGGKEVRLIRPLALFTALAGVLSLLLLTACGSDASGQVIEVVAENTRFEPAVINVPAGKEVTLKLKNLDPNEHDLEVRGLTPAKKSGGGHDGHGSAGFETIAVHARAKKTASIKFVADRPGTYEVICTIAGHEQSGMVAKLIVS